jgi:tRNA pseudouridine32 synthase/23S rRNA pseudouridine746 synthase
MPLSKKIQMIFQNEHFIVIDKPSDWLSVPSRMGKSDPRPVAGIELQNQIGKTIYPVHRLDEPVSGLLMFALTQTAHKAGNTWFEHHSIHKTYCALTSETSQEDAPDWITWTCKLAKGKKRAFIAEHGKQSITKARYQGCIDQHFHAWHLQPITGRSHQLRFEMARHHMPICGDRLYGSTKTARSGSGIDLRCFRLDFSECNNRNNFHLPESIEISEYQ